MYDRLREPTFDKYVPELRYKSERTTVNIYNKDAELIGAVPITFAYAHTQGMEYEVCDVVYGDLLNQKPEHEDIVEAIQEAVGLSASLVFAGKFQWEPNLV